jgi:hypothetical protein
MLVRCRQVVGDGCDGTGGYRRQARLPLSPSREAFRRSVRRALAVTNALPYEPFQRCPPWLGLDWRTKCPRTCLRRTTSRSEGAQPLVLAQVLVDGLGKPLLRLTIPARSALSPCTLRILMAHNLRLQLDMRQEVRT